jgi:ABC-2 type transport system permease protein
MIARIRSLIAKEFIHLRRDWWLPAFMLIGGATELILVGWATSRPITNIPLMVLDQDQTAVSREIVQALENTTTFRLYGWASDFNSIEYEMDRGSINAALIIPPGFEKDFNGINTQPSLFVILNGSESVAGIAALRAVEGVGRSFNEKLVINRLNFEEDTLASFSPSIRVWFNESLSDALYTVPAELALMLEFTVLVFAALSFSRERELGTLEQLLVMPFTSLEIIIGKALPSVIIAFTDFILMLSLTALVFDVPVRGSLLLLLLIALGYIFVELGKGLVISVVSSTQHQAFLYVMLVGMLDVVFTGYTAPVESMPPALQAIANVIPAYHWLRIFRGVTLKGVGLEVLWPNVLALLILGIVIGSFSIYFVRRALS